MADKNTKKRQSSSLIPFVAGAVAGGIAAAAAALWYEDTKKEEDEKERLRAQNYYMAPPNDDEKPTDVLQQCDICFMPFKEIKLSDDNAIVSTPCGHMFCKKCIVKALQRRKECPNCRQKMTQDNLTRLYI